ncbi:MAG: AAA family ATPase [Synergistota bacterium]|nr:AAA family ATPase [Synergistota bacterium]
MGQVFPIQGKLKEGTRDLLDRAVFHGSAISQDRSSGRRELRLSAGEGKISFMSWSTGQREFVPLLLGMYELLPGGRISRRSGVEWVILEEIEAGLHPEAVFSVMSMVLELLDRGYKVVISTHSPYVLDLLWAIRSIKGLTLSSEDKERAVCGLFDISDPAMSLKKSMSNVLDRDVRIHLLRYGQGGMVQSKEISSLDPASEDEDVSGWGGLSGYSGQVSDLVADFVSKSRRF